MSTEHSTSLHLPDVSFFGRSLREYLAFFGLSVASLRGHRILDAAAGPSSFTCEATALGIDSTAVDPLYARTETALRTLQAADFARMFAQMRRKPELFDSHTFTSLREAERDRRRAASSFLDDYYSGVAAGRYVAAQLPRLPFESGTFGLTLCAHFLFVYDELLDLDFHLAAVRELIRVTRAGGEIRLHPLVNRAGRRSNNVDHVLAGLRTSGHSVEIEAVDYSFFRGATETLVIRKQQPPGGADHHRRSGR